MWVHMKPFNVLLSDEHRITLEKMRVAFGCRSAGDAIRALIERQQWEAEADATRGIPPIAPVERLPATVQRPITRSKPPGPIDHTPMSKTEWEAARGAILKPAYGSRLKKR